MKMNKDDARHEIEHSLLVNDKLGGNQNGKIQ